MRVYCFVRFKNTFWLMVDGVTYSKDDNTLEFREGSRLVASINKDKFKNGFKHRYNNTTPYSIIKYFEEI